MTLIKNETSVTIYIEVVSHNRCPELILQSLEPGNFDSFEVGWSIHIFSDIGACVALMVCEQLSETRNFGRLRLEEDTSKNFGTFLLVQESKT